ncbi:SDR family NAD(P)-dependent oxidoreductase [Sphingorhabdus sp.]|uniref:SDR family NAD(P)-dependent oxidoreductase n=1 Tax=Sphingorhabdus sp. TaxID=1902408 RepID=UPI003783EF2E
MIRLSAGGDAFAHGADVSNPKQIEDMVATAIRDVARIDILVNNVGILRDRAFGKMSMEDWDAVVRVHLTGAVTCTMAVWPHNYLASAFRGF